ncbi:CLUMA_CG002217, isoform A [Clunio marinus]|uniref:ubiquitinyl hydrolase 1 n=1 Tax=Clunio marinus TaxID=568069 RepID=A0A1J1HK87_9DIPT|nr:CLUMA_CG002217, isoform A [Clunio marinus]
MLPSDIYHEKQSRMLCAVHCLNNLFQSRWITKDKMDQICANLSPGDYINPHKSLLGLGNYDVNAIMLALEEKSMQLNWFDKRKEISASSLELTKSFGFILNIPSDYTIAFITLPLKSRHWICIKKMADEKFYNLDSKLERPKCIGSEEDFVQYLQNEMKSNDKELFLVFPKDAS